MSVIIDIMVMLCYLMILGRNVPFHFFGCWWLIRFIQNSVKKAGKTETLTHGYSSDSTQPELSNKYQHDRV